MTASFWASRDQTSCNALRKKSAGNRSGICDHSVNQTRDSRARPLASRTSFRETYSGASAVALFLSAVGYQNVTQVRPELASKKCNSISQTRRANLDPLLHHCDLSHPLFTRPYAGHNWTPDNGCICASSTWSVA